MRLGGLLFGCVVLAGCGDSVRSDTEETGASAGTGPVGGAGAGGGAAGSGGAAGNAASESGAAGSSVAGCAGFGSSLGCIDSCLVSSPLAVSAVCETGEWHCPEGSLSLLECPAESCYGRLDTCCSPETGAELRRACGDDGMLAPCPPGHDTLERGSLCAPASVDVESCDMLNGQPCDSEEYQCTQGGGCGRISCGCYPGVDGALIWQCSWPIC
jgi:hypothetical protein